MEFRIPEHLKPAIDLIVRSLQEVLGEHLKAVLLKGSLLKGDFIPRYSDVDIHVLVDYEVMEGPRSLRLKEALRIQEKIGDIRPEEHDTWQFQIFFLSPEYYPYDWSPPLPGTYHVLYGEIPDDFEETEEGYYRRVEISLRRISGYISYLLERFTDKPNGRLPQIIRLTGAILKSTLYNAASLLEDHPFSVWHMPVWEVLSKWEGKLCPEGHLSNFFDGVRREWEKVAKDPDFARFLFEEGIKGFQALERWFDEEGRSLIPDHEEV
jgi:hypothetical protein